MADSINKNAVDGMGRSYANIDMDMLKSLMSGKVGEAKPFDTKGTDEVKDEIKKLAKLLGSKNADFVKDLQKAVKYIDEMKKVLSSVNKTISSNKEKSNFNDMANALGKVLSPLVNKDSTSIGSDSIKKAILNSNSELKIGFKNMEKSSNVLGRVFHQFIKMMEPFVDEGLKKGSIFVRDDRLGQRISKGLKIEPGTLKKVSKGIMSYGKVSTAFKEALESQGLIPAAQKRVAGALEYAAQLTEQGISESAALTQAFKRYSKGMTTEQKKEFRSNRSQFFELAKSVQESRQEAEEKTTIGAHFAGADKTLGTLKKIVDTIGPALANFTKEMANVDFSLSGIVQKSKDQYKAQLEFERSLYQTMGTAGNLAESQKVLNDLAYSYAETGVDTIEAYKMATKYQKSGIKIEKDTSRIIKGQLATEKQIGLEAGSLGDYFMDMKQSSGMAGIEVRQIGIDMGNVAKSSGLSGEAMKSVVEKSKELAKQLQSMGTFTVEANKNSLSILAEAKKLGVEDQAATLMKGMSGMNAMMKSEYSKVIIAAGRASGTVNDIMAGTIMNDPDKLNKFAQGMKDLNENAFGNIDQEEKYQVRKYEDLRRLTMLSRQGDEFAKKRLVAINAQAQTFGTTAEAMLKLPESMLAGTKSTEEKLAAINNDKTKSDEQRTKLKAQVEQEATSTLLSKLGESVTYSTGSMDDAVKAFQKEAGGELGRIGGDTASLLQKSLEDTNKRLVASGEKPLKLDNAELDKALGNKDKMQEVIATLQEGQAKAASAEQAMNNPVDRSARSLKKIEDAIVGTGQSIFSTMSGALTYLGAIVPLIGTILTTVIALKAYAKLKEAAKTFQAPSSMSTNATQWPQPTPAPPPNIGPHAPAPPPNIGPHAPAPPPNIGPHVPSPDVDGKTIKGATTVPTPALAPKLGETKGAEAVEAKGKKKISAEAVAAKSFKDAPPPTGRKSMWQKTKSFGSGVKGKIGGLFSGGAALAGGLAETAMGALGGGGGDEGGCACSVAESALSQVGSLAGVATDAATTTAEAALDAGKKTAKNVTNVADDAAKGAAKATAKGVANTADDAVKVAGKSAGLMSKATGALGKAAGFMGKAAGPLASVASVGLSIATGEDAGSAIAGGVGSAIGAAALTPFLGPVGTIVGGIAGDYLGKAAYEYAPAIWDGVKSVASTVAEFGGELWDGAKSVASDIWAGTKSVASDLWAGAQDVGGKIADGAVSLAKGIDDFTGGRISAATETLGNVASSIGSGISSAASSVGSGISSAASSVGSAASAGWSNFTGWLGFSEGAREIENNGLAMLHKGEVIFPRSIVETLVAKGTSSFGSLGGYLKDMGGGLASAASSFVESGGVGGLLGSAVTQISSSLSNTVGSIFGSPSKMSGEMATAEMQTGANKASSLSTAGSAALSSIANASESQASLSSEIKGVLKEILGEMIKSNRGEGGGDESAYSEMSSNRDAFKSPIGNINDVAVKNVSQVAYG